MIVSVGKGGEPAFKHVFGNLDGHRTELDDPSRMW